MEDTIEDDNLETNQPRGKTWSQDEVLSLLEIWSELKLQAKLKSNYRNLGIFKEVSKEMAKRNHQRTAEECRSKSKKLRFEYRRVVRNNRMSGRQPVTCPYYKELDSIFQGDVSIAPNRLSRSIAFELEGVETHGVLDPAQQNNSDSSNNEFNLSLHSNQDSFQESDETDIDEQTVLSIPITVIETGDQQHSDVNSAMEIPTEGSSNYVDGIPRELQLSHHNEIPATMSPGSRLNKSKNRNRRARRGEHIAQKIMESASREAELARNTQERLIGIISDSLNNCRQTEVELLQILKDDIDRSERDRRRMIDCMENMTNLYREKIGGHNKFQEQNKVTGNQIDMSVSAPSTKKLASKKKFGQGNKSSAETESIKQNACTHSDFSNDVFACQPDSLCILETDMRNDQGSVMATIKDCYVPDTFPGSNQNFIANIADNKVSIKNEDFFLEKIDTENTSEIVDKETNNGFIEETNSVIAGPGELLKKALFSRSGRVCKKKKIYSP